MTQEIVRLLRIACQNGKWSIIQSETGRIINLLQFQHMSYVYVQSIIIIAGLCYLNKCHVFHSVNQKGKRTRSVYAMESNARSPLTSDKRSRPTGLREYTSACAQIVLRQIRISAFNSRVLYSKQEKLELIYLVLVVESYFLRYIYMCIIN